MAATIEMELWNIFTCYTLHGCPRDPSRITETQFLKLCKDSAVFNPSMVDVPLTQADLHLIWTSELKACNKSAGSSESGRLDYKELLSCLIRVAARCYPNCSGSEESMQQLLMDNILPMAARRRPVSLTSFVSQPMIEDLFEYYQEALHEIFRYYANNSDNISRNMIKSTASKSRTFDEQKSLIAEARERTQARTVTASQMNYEEFLSFASDFGLASSMALTTLDLGDIFLTVISTQSFETTLRSISFREFWEVLVRCALVAFRKTKDIPTEDKLKGMFLYMWRHMQQSMLANSSGGGSRTAAAGGFTIFQGGLLRGSKILNERFIMAWNKDGFRDYLDRNHSRSAADTAHNDGSVIEKVVGIPAKSKHGTKDDSKRSGVTAERPATRAKTPPRHITVNIHINDNDDLNDERIQPQQLRKLLQSRPDLAQLLYECVVEEGLDQLEDEDDDLDANT
mmetsp:Transcript_14822/g.22313  ORF Transcript_14822/g.22313 Transcript_14822/m.22313 type:complete len:455 (-) Transcript_14822:230-1594(-)